MCRDVSVAVAANADSESPVRKAGSSGEINSNGKCTEFWVQKHQNRKTTKDRISHRHLCL